MNTKTKFVRQARLPKEVYQEIRGQQAMDYFAQKAEKNEEPTYTPRTDGRTYCKCHPLNSFDPMKYGSCFVCYQKGRMCCLDREEQEEKERR